MAFSAFPCKVLVPVIGEEEIPREEATGFGAPSTRPAGTLSLAMRGVVERIFITHHSGEPMVGLADVEALRGCGLRGDRYVNRTGHWSGVDECHVTLIEGEILDRIAEDTGLQMEQGQHRRNIVTRGVRLAQLLGKRFMIGKAVFEYHKPRPPCSHLQTLCAPGTARALFGQRGGIGARVLRTGLIQINDEIRVC